MCKKTIRIVCFFVLVLLLLVGSTFYINFRTVRATWDPSPQNLVVTVEKVWEEIDYSYIPDVQIWGDGKIIWVENSPEGNRKVFQGKLEPQEIATLLNRIIDLGFFKPTRKSEGFAGTYITANLIDKSRSEWVDPVDQELMEFVTFLKAGAGNKGNPYVPSGGKVFAFPIEDTEYKNITKADFLWPKDLFNPDLETISNEKDGIEISGEKLMFVWQVVNSPHAAVESEGKIYWIYLKVDDLSE